jgi:hypothetical protein
MLEQMLSTQSRPETSLKSLNGECCGSSFVEGKDQCKGLHGKWFNTISLK